LTQLLCTQLPAYKNLNHRLAGMIGGEPDTCAYDRRQLENLSQVAIFYFRGLTNQAFHFCF